MATDICGMMLEFKNILVWRRKHGDQDERMNNIIEPQLEEIFDISDRRHAIDIKLLSEY